MFYSQPLLHDTAVCRFRDWRKNDSIGKTSYNLRKAYLGLENDLWYWGGGGGLQRGGIGGWSCTVKRSPYLLLRLNPISIPVPWLGLNSILSILRSPCFLCVCCLHFLYTFDTLIPITMRTSDSGMIGTI